MGLLSVWVASADSPTVTRNTANVVPDTYTLNWNTWFTAWTITVTDWTTTITILDRNLWATAAWTWCEDRAWNNTTCAWWHVTYWYHFQWWNNYWFPSVWNLPDNQKSETLVESGSITIPYSSPVFIANRQKENWLNDNIGNLWWWSEDDTTYNVNNDTWKVTNAPERKWPCPDGFHVPSIWELQKLSSMFKVNNSPDGAAMYNKLLIPLAGYRYNNEARLGNLGHNAYLLSSSPVWSTQAGNLGIQINYDRDAIVYSENWRYDRANAYSVRCFYDNYTEYWATTATEITNINISWITNPIIWQQPTVAWLTVTSTPENAIDLDSVLVPAWRASDNWTDNGYRNLIHDQSGISWSRPPFNKTPLFYFIRIIFTPKDWYTLAENYTVTANDWYSSIRTWKSDNLYNPLPSSSLNDPGSQNKYSAWLNYIHIIYYTADIPETAPVTTTQISSISITWITLPVGWATPTTEWISSTTTWIAVSNRNTIWNMNYELIRCSIGTQTQLCGIDLPMFEIWVQYAIQIPFTIGEWYGLVDQFSTNNVTDSLGNNASEMSISNRVLVFRYTATGAQNQSGSWEWWGGSWWWNNWWSSSSSSSLWWWGWGWKTVTKTGTKTDETKAEEVKQEENKAENNENKEELNIPERTQEELQKVLEDWLTQEFHDAYDFGHYYWITTMPSAKEADMNGPLTRIAMAKMLSNYAINVLWKKPANKVVPKFPDIDEKLNKDYGWAVDLAYQLWIMWIWIDNFRPFDLVPRSEFGTTLSRMLFGTADWDGAYYETHMKKLKEEWIITNDNPNLQEARWYVMIMLMRSAKK